MFKRLFTLLLSLLLIPSAIGVSSFSKDNKASVMASSLDDGDEYPYTEESPEDSYFIERTYLTPALAPTIERHFAAPSGYTFTLSIKEEQINTILDHAEAAGGNFNVMIDLIYYYSLAGSKIYANSQPYYPSGRDDVFNYINSHINGFVLFEANELHVKTTIDLFFTFEFYTDGDKSYNFNFQSEPIVFEPYNEFDFISINSFYYEERDAGERRVTVYASPIEGFFYEEPLYNEFGFHTDTVNDGKDPQSEEKPLSADYELMLVAYDTIPLQDIKTSGGMEMTYPNEPMEIKARLRFKSGGVEYTYYSETIVVADPNMCVAIDGYPRRASIEKGTEHEFSFSANGIISDDINSLSLMIDAYPYHLEDEDSEIELFETGKLPTTGEKDKVYYLPSQNEINAYKNGNYVENLDEVAEGMYYIWDEEKNEFTEYFSVMLIDGYYFVDDETSTLQKDDFKVVASLPFAGKWQFNINAYLDCIRQSYGLNARDQFVDVVSNKKSEAELSFNVANDINLVVGGKDIDIIPTISNIEEEVEYYYSYDVSKHGIINIEEKDNGVLSISAINAGLVSLTLSVESKLFSKISKTINIRVLDAIYDIAQIEVPDEFHYSGQDLTSAINIRGFTSFQNIDINWSVLNKKGEELSDEQYVDNKDASITLIKPESDDYTIIASYEGIEISRITIQVRSIDVNKFVRNNIWWIFLITIAFVVLILFLRSLTRKGRTTVQSIQRAYDVYYACLSDDKLTKAELIRVKREITRCLHRVEDLNIEALNQYEKAIRYLKKSLNDSKELLKKWDTLSLEDRSVHSEQLSNDLSKALDVSKAIEDAKDLVEKRHAQANRKNFESIDNKKDKKKK